MTTSANVDISQIKTAKDLAEEAEIAEQQKALSYLRQTDWIVIRRAETGQSIPQDVVQKRAEARLRLCPVRKP